MVQNYDTWRRQAKKKNNQNMRKQWMRVKEKKMGLLEKVDRSRVGLVTNTHLPSADLRRTSAVIGGYLLDKLKRRRRRHKLSQVWRWHVGHVQASPSSFIDHHPLLNNLTDEAIMAVILTKTLIKTALYGIVAVFLYRLFIARRRILRLRNANLVSPSAFSRAIRPHREGSQLIKAQHLTVHARIQSPWGPFPCFRQSSTSVTARLYGSYCLSPIREEISKWIVLYRCVAVQ